MDLALLLLDFSPKPNSHAEAREVEEATEGEGQQGCSPSQVEVRWARPFHKSPVWLSIRIDRQGNSIVGFCQQEKKLRFK